MALQRALLGDENKNDASSSSSRQHHETKNDWYCCAALDHSDLCASVYRHNFPLQHNNTNTKNKKKKKSTTTTMTTRIESLTVEQLVAWRADLWMMSPPCQPHTRQHERPHQPDDDREDARSQSFLHLCQLLSSEQLPFEYRPALILLENVVGFGQSHSCRVFREALEAAGYVYQQFHWQPTQVGLPNDRPRYYSVAVLRSRLVPMRNGQGDGDDCLVARLFGGDHSETAPASNEKGGGCIIQTSLPELGVVSERDVQAANDLPALSSFLDKHPVDDDNDRDDLPLRIPKAVLEKPAAWCLDIVTPDSRRTSCFTASYGKYLKGTGSVLLCKRRQRQQQGQGDNRDSNNNNVHSEPLSFELVAPEQRQYDPDWKRALLSDDSKYYLRYFSGTELARLFDFPDSFRFPEQTTMSQQWKLLGNSLNVRVASRLVALGLRAVDWKAVMLDREQTMNKGLVDCR